LFLPFYHIYFYYHYHFYYHYYLLLLPFSTKKQPAPAATAASPPWEIAACGAFYPRKRKNPLKSSSRGLYRAPESVLKTKKPAVQKSGFQGKLKLGLSGISTPPTSTQICFRGLPLDCELEAPLKEFRGIPERMNEVSE